MALGLQELVEVGSDRASGCWQTHLGEELQEVWPFEHDLPACATSADLGQEVARLCAAGQFERAQRATRLHEALLPDGLFDFAGSLEDRPGWEAFRALVELVERIDSFLSLEERDPTTGRLARACRGDLALLGVLADWCQDAGRPRAAEEARHLAGLVRSHVLGT